MNNKKIIKSIKILILICFTLIIIICFFARKTYSTFIYSTDSDIELKINELNYTIMINDIRTNNILVPKGNSVIDLKILSNNDVSTYYKLLYLENPNIDIYYIENEPYGLIDSNEEKCLKLYIINRSISLEKIIFNVSGGYNTNSLNDIIIDLNYKEVDKQINVGDYIEYKPNGIENKTKYIIDSKYNGIDYEQEVFLLDTKYRIFNINIDGSIDIVSDNSLYIDSKNNKLRITGVKGYINYINVINSIINTLYGNSEYAISSENISINHIITKLKNSPSYIKNEYFLNDIYYPDISSNNYIFGNTNIIENYYKIDLSKENYIDKIYYELINNNEEYYLLDGYIIKDNIVRFGIYSISNNSIKYNDLYLSNNTSKTYDLKFRPIITLSSYTKLKYDGIKWIIE